VSADFLKLLKQAQAAGKPLIWDGAVGTQLIARGLIGRASEEWNLSRTDAITAIHADYFAAGAVAAQTNTFGGNRLKLKLAGLEDKLFEVNARAVEAARAACPPDRLVAGDLGPTGQMLKPAGDLAAAEAEEVFAEQAQALATAGVDLFSLETFFDLSEAVAAVRGARRVSELPVIASLTFRLTKRGYFTINGVTPEAAAKGLLEAGAAVVGANCTLGPTDMAGLVQAFRRATATPLIFQPNAGNPRLVEGKEVYDQTAEDFARQSLPLRAAGADILGACCGSNPDFIRQLARKF
jgi:5-methyltetrahydrofolate--homocysteine methyltransferase